MTRSFLRKRRAPTSDDRQQSNLRPTLSLPDLTTPLLDPASWGELPSFDGVKTNRAPSLVSSTESTGSPIRFHRPFTPWQVVNVPISAQAKPHDVFGDFWKSSAPSWKASSETEKITMPRKRSWKGKGLTRLNVLVVGGKGAGKTNFIDLLWGSLEEEGRHRESTSRACVCQTPSSNADANGASSSSTSTSTTSAQAQSVSSQPQPTSRVSCRTVLVDTPKYHKTSLRLIDTPGLPTSNEASEQIERDIGITTLLRIIEERFDERLREESRIVRRPEKGEDDLIHLVIYIIDARDALRPVSTPGPKPSTIDWSSKGLRDETAGSADDSPPVTSAGFVFAEIDAIRRLACRANVLPILTHTDALTISELEAVREAVRRDLLHAFRDELGCGFGMFGADEEDDGRKTPTLESISSGHSRQDSLPPTPPLTIDDHAGLTRRLPFAIFAPEPGHAQGRKRFLRQYLWGEADAIDPKQSDLLLLRDAILEVHRNTLRSTTREVLYERYRTERLMAMQDCSA